MICKHCGAPVADGLTVCPYCRAQLPVQAAGPVSGDETIFAGDLPDSGMTDFREPSGLAPAAQPAYTPAGGGFAPPPQPAPAQAPKAKKSRRAKTGGEKKSKKGGNKMNLVLAAVLAVLILVLLLR